jgi:hypothetical protein
MSKHIGHHITIDEDIFVDSNFLNQLRNIGIVLKHILFGDFMCDHNGFVVTFIRKDGSMATPEGFIGRPHIVHGNKDTIKLMVEEMKLLNSTEEV